MNPPHPPPSPSRASNPFATCWTRPGALPYLTTTSVSIERVLARLEAAGWRGQVVGSHGVGKSTLLLALAERLRERGHAVVSVNLPAGEVAQEVRPGAVLMVEGFERRTRRDRRALLGRWRRSDCGFVIATHRAHRDPRRPLVTLATLRPDMSLLERLFSRLTAARATPVTFADARRAFIGRDGRLRDVWFDLYDLHERYTRAERTAEVAVAYSAADGAV